MRDQQDETHVLVAVACAVVYQNLEALSKTETSDMPTLSISAGDSRLLTYKKPPARFWKYPTFLPIFGILSCKNILGH